MDATVSHLLMLQKYINSKQKSKIKDYTLCFVNTSKDFTIDNIKKTGLKGKVLILILLILMIF